MAPRVLVIEDDAVNLELAVAMLEEAGYEGLAATSAEAALRLRFITGLPTDDL
ncbi:MAG: hypothetical protein HYV46_19110 [candidate division NC10 bacterium]|nr:hypothetical protein [candidate division NC10 bacterium]